MARPQFNKDRPLSYSAINLFTDPQWGSPEKWYMSYVLGEKQFSKEMTFGSKVDKQIQNDPDFLPELPRYPLMQHRMTAEYKGIPLIGLPDGLCFTEYLLADYKTGKGEWTQKKADDTDQLTMYLCLIWLTEKIKAENFKCFIHWLPTQDQADLSISFAHEFKIQTFQTRRTMADLTNFFAKITATYAAMQKFTDEISESRILQLMAEIENKKNKKVR